MMRGIIFDSIFDEAPCEGALERPFGGIVTVAPGSDAGIIEPAAAVKVAPNNGIFGRGRHGTAADQRLLASHMRESRARRRCHAVADELCGVVSQIIEKQARGGVRRRFRLTMQHLWKGVRNQRAKNMLKLAIRQGLKSSARKTSCGDMLEMSLGSLANKKCGPVALMYGLSATWVRVCRNVVAQSYIHWQGRTLGQLVLAC